jgi:hypothetical protein
MKVTLLSKERAEVDSNILLGVVCCLIICATAGFVASRMGASPQPPRRLWSPVVIETNGSQTALGDSRQLEFWTPSAETKDYLRKDGDTITETERWQIISNDDPVVQFGNLLRTNNSVLGYRRIPEWGQGRTEFKPGWWWTVNVLTNYTAAELGRAYQDFWKSGQSVFIEVVDNRGRTD